MQKFTAIIVGASFAGLSAAYSLGRDGVDVLVVERGEYPGAKSVTGGRLYFGPIMSLFPELWADAPWERHVTRETLTMMGHSASMTFDFTSQRYGKPPYHSFTVLASRFNKWLAKKATEKGARIISKYKVDDLVMDNGRVVGISVGGSKIECNVLIAADGIVSVMAEKAGLRSGQRLSKDYAVAAKQVIGLAPETIESRFSLGPSEGMARLFFGAVTKGILGSGFLYTNKDSVSLVVVLRIKDLIEKKCAPQDILEELRSRPEVGPLVKNGELLEYSAHILSESGLSTVPRLFGNGILVVGDAAGFLLNMGLTVRGMDFAIISGALAAETVKLAKQKDDYSANSLSRYGDMIKDSPIPKEMETFKHVPKVLDNPRLLSEYPEKFCAIMQDLYEVSASPKDRISSTILRHSRGKWVQGICDVFRLRKI